MSVEFVSVPEPRIAVAARVNAQRFRESYAFKSHRTNLSYCLDSNRERADRWYSRIRDFCVPRFAIEGRHKCTQLCSQLKRAAVAKAH
jgi:hypothetical protein